MSGRSYSLFWSWSSDHRGCSAQGWWTAHEPARRTAATTSSHWAHPGDRRRPAGARLDLPAVGVRLRCDGRDELDRQPVSAAAFRRPPRPDDRRADHLLVADQAKRDPQTGWLGAWGQGGRHRDPNLYG